MEEEKYKTATGREITLYDVEIHWEQCDIFMDASCDCGLHKYDFRDYLVSQTLQSIRQAKDDAYSERNRLVSFLARLYPAHLKRHPDDDKTWEDEWRCIVCIHSPAGQLTWHIHDSETKQFGFLNRKPDPFTDCVWDGHTTEEKYRRLAELPLAKRNET